MGSPRHREGGVEDQAATLGYGTWPVPDSIFGISDDGDPTKIIAFQASGITSGATRTLTVPDLSGTLALLEAANVFTANQKITKASANKSLRMVWNDGVSRVAVNFYPKGKDKTQVTIDHSRLESAKDVAATKSRWKASLEELQKKLQQYG